MSLFDQDFELAPLLGEIAVLVAALYAARKLRFPLLLLAATVAKAVLVLDTVAGIFGTGNWLAWAALLLGLAELGTTVTLRGDRSPWAFWKHVAAAILIGAAVIRLLDGSGVGWVLIGVVSLAYLGVARSTGRSVWAVAGALGLLLVTSHFVDEGDAVVGTGAGASVRGGRRRARALADGARSTRASASSTSCSDGCSDSRRCTAGEPG